MATQMDIINAALIALGESPAISINDNTKPMRLVRAIYEMKRDSLLREHPWKCCIKQTILSPPLATAPPFAWAYAFQLPADFLRLVRLDYLNTPFQIEGKTLLCDSSSVPFVYVFQNVTEGTWDVMLAEAMSAKLAYELVMPITADAQKKQIMFNDYKMKINQAKFTNAIESEGDQLEASQLLTARLAWSGLPQGISGANSY